MIALYLHADGTEDDWQDALPFRFWPLAEIEPVEEEFSEPTHPDHSRYPGHFLFADYLLWSHGYAVNLNQPALGIGTIARVGGPCRTEVADWRLGGGRGLPKNRAGSRRREEP
jgi:hypothetical protein